MHDTIQPTPNAMTLGSEAGGWQSSADIIDNNPAAEARAEYFQHTYAEALTAPEPANSLETVPAQGEIAGYATARVIDPQHAETVLAAAATAVDNAYGATPEMQAAAVARENRERQAVAITQADAYAPRLLAMRDRALRDWGMPGDNSLN